MCVILDWHLDCMLIAALLFENYLGLIPDFCDHDDVIILGSIIAPLRGGSIGDEGFSSQRASHVGLRFWLRFSFQPGQVPKEAVELSVIWYAMALCDATLLKDISLTDDIDGSVQDSSTSIANALEILQSWPKQSIWWRGHPLQEW